jgi:hypothetical protein
VFNPENPDLHPYVSPDLFLSLKMLLVVLALAPYIAPQ